MTPIWTCTNVACDFSNKAWFAHYCPWCGQDLEPFCECCGNSLLSVHRCSQSDSVADLSTDDTAIHRSSEPK